MVFQLYTDSKTDLSKWTMVIAKVPFPLGAASEVAYQDSAMVGDQWVDSGQV